GWVTVRREVQSLSQVRQRAECGFISLPCLPSSLRHRVQYGSFAPRALPRLVATTSRAAAVSSSVDFPSVRLYDLPGSTACAMGRGRFLQLLAMPLSPCYP